MGVLDKGEEDRGRFRVSSQKVGEEGVVESVEGVYVELNGFDGFGLDYRLHFMTGCFFIFIIGVDVIIGE